jgi:hypothetical protein
MRNFFAIAIFLATPALAAGPNLTSARVIVSGPQFENAIALDQNPFASTAEASLPPGSSGSAGAKAYAFLGKLGTRAEVGLAGYTPDPGLGNSASAIAIAGFTDSLTAVSVNPFNLAKVSLAISGSVPGNGGLTGNFGDSRFGVTFGAASADGLRQARFDLLTLISADPVSGAPVLNSTLTTEYLFAGNIVSSSVTTPANPFATYDWLFPFDAGQAWTFTGTMSCIAFTAANVTDTSNLSCLLDNSATWMGMSLLDANLDPVAGAVVNSLSGQNYNIAYAPFSGAVPEPASWALLIAGFGLVGAVARRSRALRPLA